MAGIYNADIYCDDCIDRIKDDIARDLWAAKARCPDGTACNEFLTFAEFDEYLRDMDERDYDSGEYPKYCDDHEESDSPQHCGAGEGCVNADDLGDGHKFGCFLENDLTSDGYDYVAEAVRDDLRSGCDDSIAVMVWAPFYDIEVGSDDDEDDDDADEYDDAGFAVLDG